MRTRHGNEEVCTVGTIELFHFDVAPAGTLKQMIPAHLYEISYSQFISSTRRFEEAYSFLRT
jgi:hypothetical protein